MFGLGAGKSAYPPIYSKSSSIKNPQRREHEEKSHSFKGKESSADSLEPAIDGPPSPERIRAYTEQMKRSSIFGNNSSRTTLSSGASSFRSRESVLASTENLALSRKSSGRSSSSSMPASRTERPESVQIFGRTLFSRHGRRTKANKNNALGEEINEESSPIDHHEARGGRSRKGTMTSISSLEPRTRQPISSPFNFQHVNHAGQDRLPNLTQVSEAELVSEFSAIRASQMPTKGELNGIQAQDLHFKNFSSVALDTTSNEQHGARPRSNSQRQRAVLRKHTVSPLSPRSLTYAKSYDTFKSPAPPRPPRSPLSPTCPVALPARTSSRTASVLFDTFDPLATTSIERPHVPGGFRRPGPLSVPSPISPPQDDYNSYFGSPDMPHAVTTPRDEAWPLMVSPSGHSGAELPDVQEEEEYFVKRQSRLSTSSGELRMSQSVPALRLRSLSQSGGPESPIRSQRPPLSPGFRLGDDSWDNAIDYAYEHEAEADCDYQWDQCSVEDDSTTIAEEPAAAIEKPTHELHLDDSRPSLYTGRFRPSLLVPCVLDLPELSPMSLASTSSSDPRTPSNFLRPHHARSSSHASSFKESHGFTLSPSLLIPSDFKSQMDHDSLYEHYSHDASASMFPQDHCILPLHESVSSAASNWSSGFSRGSARSSSSTRISTAHSRGSQDFTILLSRAASLNAAHRSIGSASSLPDLIPSTTNRTDKSDGKTLSRIVVEALRYEEDESDDAASPLVSSSSTLSLQPQQKSLETELDLQAGDNQLAPPSKPFVENKHGNLSPVAESFTDSAAISGSTHGRKFSAPVVSHSVKEFKGRARSASSTGGLGKKQRGSYMLFPQV